MSRYFFIILSVFLVGCSTSYQPTGLTGGFSSTQLSENIWKVNFKGNGYTSAEKAADFCMLRCSEICLANGFTHFAVVDSQERTKLNSFTTPVQTRTNFNANAYTYGNNTNVFGNANTTSYGGQTYMISKPRSSNTILCFKDKPQGGNLVYSAMFLKKSLSQKYGLNDSPQQSKPSAIGSE